MDTPRGGSSRLLFLARIEIWNVDLCRERESGGPGEKPLNQQQTQSIWSRNRTQATMVGGRALSPLCHSWSHKLGLREEARKHIIVLNISHQLFKKPKILTFRRCADHYVFFIQTTSWSTALKIYLSNLYHRERTGALNPTQGGILSSNKHDFVGGQHSCTVQNQKTKQVLCLVTDNLECFYGASARLKKKN